MVVIQPDQENGTLLTESQSKSVERPESAGTSKWLMKHSSSMVRGLHGPPGSRHSGGDRNKNYFMLEILLTLFSDF